MRGGEADQDRAAELRGRSPWASRRGLSAAAGDAKAPAGGSCAPAAAGAAATTPRGAQSLALALASWRWGCRRCGGCCCACYCRGPSCYTETPAFGAFALAHTRSHPRRPGERRPRDIGIEINNKVRSVREGLIDVEGQAGVSHSPVRRGGVRGKRRSSSAAPWLRPLTAELGRGARARKAASGLPHFLLHCFCFLILFSWLVWSSARKAGRILKKHTYPQMAGKRLANSPRLVFVNGIGAVYCTLSVKPSPGLGVMRRQVR